MDELDAGTDADGSSDLAEKATSVTYQAEASTAAGGCVVARNRAGYTGSGFMDFGGQGTFLEWNNVSVSASGAYALSVRYANASAGNRPSDVIVNGTKVGSLSFASTGSWTRWKTASFKATLRSGSNRIRIVASTSAGGPNIDSMNVSGGSSGGSGGSSSGSGNLRVRVGGSWVSVGCGGSAPRADGSSDKWLIIDRKLRNQDGVYLFCDEGWADGRACECSRRNSEGYHAITQADFNVADSARKHGNSLTTSVAARGSMYIFPNNAHEFCLAVGTNSVIQNKDGGDDGRHHESSHTGRCNEWCFGDGCP
jgi:hypothetical protein